MDRAQTNTSNSTKHAEQQDVMDIQNKLFLFILFFLNTVLPSAAFFLKSMSVSG